MILVASVVTLVSIFVTRPAHGVRLEQDDGKGFSNDQLHIFAATFNAANADSKTYSEKQTKELLRALTEGHEDAGKEADLVILGFQEFRDYKSSFGIEAKDSHVWRKLSEKAMYFLEKEINDIVTIPKHIHEAKATMLKEFQGFHTKLRDQLETFRNKFGDSSTQFHKHLADNSKLTSWEVENMTSKMNLLVKERVNEQLLADNHAAEKQYHNFTLGVEELKEMTNAHPKATWIRDAMKPIHQWTESALQNITRIRNRYPNINYTNIGKAAWANLRARVDGATHVQDSLIKNKKQQSNLQSEMDGLLAGVKKAVDIDEQDISNKLYGDLTAIKDAVTTLNIDIMNLVHDGNKYQAISSGAGKTNHKWNNLAASMSSWDRATEEILNKLLLKASFQMFPNQYEMTMGIHKFLSGSSCYFVTHYDTVLYVYVNPWSEWKISPVNYVSNTCKQGSKDSGSNMGCSIDNRKSAECGKVVNLQVFQAQKGQKSIRVCALNTHMSYAGEANDRMKYIKAAVEEAKNTECDTMVFVGDFNSRMHCDSATASIPPYDRLDAKTNSSFQYIVNNICPSGTCTLKGLEKNIIYYDELMQMMDKNKLNCLEKRTQKKSVFSNKEVWVNVEIENELKNLNLFEAGVPDWAPTYKVAPASKAEKLPKEWHLCAEKTTPYREQSCFMNKVGKGKHNPSWTDRILVWPSEGTKAIPKATAYLRRSIDPALGSDHVPVVTKVTVTVP